MENIYKMFIDSHTSFPERRFDFSMGSTKKEGTVPIIAQQTVFALKVIQALDYKGTIHNVLLIETSKPSPSNVNEGLLHLDQEMGFLIRAVLDQEERAEETDDLVYFNNWFTTKLAPVALGNFRAYQYNVQVRRVNNDYIDSIPQ